MLVIKVLISLVSVLISGGAIIVLKTVEIPIPWWTTIIIIVLIWWVSLVDPKNWTTVEGLILSAKSPMA
jgi:hypothetical protein